jgi:hypothetical protein
MRYMKATLFDTFLLSSLAIAAHAGGRDALAGARAAVTASGPAAGWGPGVGAARAAGTVGSPPGAVASAHR